MVGRSGGFAGFDDQIVIQPDGFIEQVRGAGAVDEQLDDEILARLAAALSAVGAVEGDGVEEGADYFVYTVDYEGSSVVFTSFTEDTELFELAAVIEAMFSGQ